MRKMALLMLVLGGCGGGGTAPVSKPSPAPPPPVQPPPPVVDRTATVSWAVPKTNTDGSALTNLAGYEVHYGTSALNMAQTAQINDAASTSYTVTGLTRGTWYFAVSDYTTANVSSGYSTVVSKTIN